VEAVYSEKRREHLFEEEEISLRKKSATSRPFPLERGVSLFISFTWETSDPPLAKLAPSSLSTRFVGRALLSLKASPPPSLQLEKEPTLFLGGRGWHFPLLPKFAVRRV